MRALAITYERNAGAGVFADAARDRSVQLDGWLQTEQSKPPADPRDYDAVLCFGGAMNVDEEEKHPWLREDRALLGELVERGTPVMGICLGAQILTQAIGGAVTRLPDPEIGWYEIALAEAASDDPLLSPMAPRFEGFEWHSYSISPPPGAVELAHTPACIQAYRLGEVAWAIQFHAEVALADAESWLDHYREDPDAVRIGLDAPALRDETRAKIGAWNELGRELCGRFFDAVPV